MGELLRLISDCSNVELAWREVLANDLADGELSRSGERFLDNGQSSEATTFRPAVFHKVDQFHRS